MKKLVILGVFLLVLSGCANTGTTPEEQNENTDQNKTTETQPQEITETVNWKKFENKKHEFSFSTPENFLIQSNCHATSAEECSNISVLIPKKIGSLGILGIDIQLPELFFNPDEYQNLGLEEFSKKLWDTNKNDTNPNVDKKTSELVKTKIGKYDAYKFTLIGSFKSDKETYGLDTETTYVIINNGKDNYLFHYTTGNKYSEDILDTFAFTN